MLLACIKACITINKTIGEHWQTYSGYLGELQVDTTEEHILYKDCDALDYAHRTWRSLSSNAIMTPLNGLVSLEQLQELEPTYLNVVQAMAGPWETADGVQNPYVMLWCSATKSEL